MAKKSKLQVVVENKERSAKQDALQAALKNIEKSFGKGSIMRMGDDAAQIDVDVISTSSIGIDAALGIGGIPRGRITEIYGPESSGKTTLALHIIAQAQQNNGYAAFIDAEHALDPVYSANLGVDLDELLISQPDTGEQALEILEALVRSGALDVIVVDSVAALVPRAEIDGEMGDSHMGLHARLMSQALRKLTGIIKKSNTAVIFINQLREKVGVSFGNPEVTTGGRALKFYSTVRIDIRRGESIKKGQEIIGSRTKVRIMKNKMAPPFKTAEFEMIYGEGISKTGDLLDTAVDLDIIKKSGSWFSYDGENIGQGREKVKDYMDENQDFTEMIDEMVRKEVFKDVRKEDSNESNESEELQIFEENRDASEKATQGSMDLEDFDLDQIVMEDE